ncbi:outer membrane lipoprotein-sorting protein [Marimonas sp. MJW-29]|uniref:Outer membrane lipoprotein-sorting protein n=1 Tax=Sulfitobacter sediminis TaxID=3234186 RepID=A0ABV3RML7_9RHOB
MTMLKRREILAGAAGLALFGGRAARAETARERGLRIATDASNRRGGYRDISATGEMVLRTASNQTSNRRFDASWIDAGRNDSRSLLIFRWPGDIRNTALLTHAYPTKTDDQWLFLPAMERVRRIRGSGRSGSFVGSEFAFEDMVDQEVAKFDHIWIADERCPGSGTCHVIDMIPRSPSGYSRQRVWLDTKELRLQRVQYFYRGGAHLKTLTVGKYRLYNNRFWRAGQMVMENHLTGAGTTLNWKDYVFDRGLNANAFTVNALRRIN